LQKKINTKKVRGDGSSHDVRMVSGMTDRSSINTNNDESVDEQQDDIFKGAVPKGGKI
jgi:hypothetical protein